MPCKHAEQSEEPYGRICLQCGIVLEHYEDEREGRDHYEFADALFYACADTLGLVSPPRTQPEKEDATEKATSSSPAPGHFSHKRAGKRIA